MRVTTIIRLIKLACIALLCIQCKSNTNAIISGVPWYTQNGKNVSAHGANIIKEGDTFYLFGEYKNNTSNQFNGFSCYSSKDLTNWKFESIAFPPNKTGRLSGVESIGERPKVMKCPSTGEYIMYFHADANGYRNPAVEYAVAKQITGPYMYKGRLMFGDTYIKRWDMGTFQDTDGKGYIILHHGDIYELAKDYKSIVKQTLKHDKTLRTESPAVFKHNETYYWIGSGLTGWERNDNEYFTATNLSGPWTKHGIIAPKGSLTWNSQSSFVLPIIGSKTTTYMYMGDRWSFPKQQATATYVWQPLVFNNEDGISMPEFQQSWAIDVSTGKWKSVSLEPKETILFNDADIIFTGDWETVNDGELSSKRANSKHASLKIPFTGKQIALKGIAAIDCGYAHLTIKNEAGNVVHDTWVDMYSNKTVNDLQYVSPVFPKDNYTLTLSPTETHWYWVEKSGKKWGSKNTFISFQEALIF